MARLELHWYSQRRPLPTRWVLPANDSLRRGLRYNPDRPSLNFCSRVRLICNDLIRRCEVFRHIRMSAVLLSFTPSRNMSRFGLQARTTPLRFRGGRLTRTLGPIEYQVQRYFVDSAEMLYLVTFCLPRFFEQCFEEKLVTIAHELYHIGPAFDGDLRRHPGRYTVHSDSKQVYDAHIRSLVQAYLKNHPKPELFDILLGSYRDLWQRHNGIVGTLVPRPKLLPVSRPQLVAAREC